MPTSWTLRAEQRPDTPLSSKVSGPVRTADAELLSRCRGGDLAAFEELYRQHGGRLYNLAYRMLGNAADAEDLTQEAFLLAYQKIDGFREDSALGTWLYRLTVNLCIDYLRSRAARQARLTGPLEPDRLLPTRGTARESPVTRIDLEGAIASLPPGSRAAFLLHDVEGFEHREMADLLGIAEGTSKSQVHKARMRIRALLRSEP
jgi:RNA polymerase sigma-70 factor (ECF subfamily)